MVVNALLAVVLTVDAAVVCSFVVGASRRREPRSVQPIDHEQSIAGARGWLGRRRARRDAAGFDRRLPAFADAIARELRAGAALTTALFAAGPLAGPPIAADVERLARRVARGDDLGGALADWSRERPSPGLDQLIAVVSIGSELGGELASAFELAADSLRDRLALADEIGSLTSQSRASGLLLTGLPPIAALGLAALNPGSGRFLVATTGGLACVAAAVSLDVVGWFWMRGLSRSVR